MESTNEKFLLNNIVMRAVFMSCFFLASTIFLIYLLRRLKFSDILSKFFLCAIVTAGYLMSISDLLGLLIFLQSNVSELSISIVVLNFFHAILPNVVIFIHTSGLYIRSRDVVEGNARKIVKFLLVIFLLLTFGIFLSEIILIASTGVENLERIPGTSRYKNRWEDYLGIASGVILIIMDFIFLYEFHKYYRATSNVFEGKNMNFSHIIISEGTKMIVLSICALISYVIYAIVETEIGFWFFVPFRFSILLIFLLWIKLHIRLSSNKTGTKYSFSGPDSKKQGHDGPNFDSSFKKNSTSI